MNKPYPSYSQFVKMHSVRLLTQWPKPHIYKQGKQWVCRQNLRSQIIVERAAKPVTAYRAFQRRLKWERAGRPGAFR